MVKRRIRNGKVEEYVQGHPWSYLGKPKHHPGYWRPRRPVGRKRIISKKTYKLRNIRDQYGHIVGKRSVR